MSAIDRPLKLGPEPLNGVGVDRAAHVFAAAMVHGPVLEPESLGVAIGGKFVRVERGAGLYVVPEVSEDFSVRETAHRLHVDLAPAFYHADHRCLASSPTATLSGAHAANVGFIRLHNTLELAGLVVPHQLANLVGHAPCGLVRDSEVPLQFLRGHAVAGSGHEEHGEEPKFQGGAGLVEDGASGRGHLKAAPRAGIAAAGNHGIEAVLMLAIGASDAVFPAGLEDVFEAGPVIREKGIELL